MSKLIAKLHSRRFLMAVAAFTAALAKGNLGAAAVISAIYVAAESYVDGQAAGVAGPVVEVPADSAPADAS